MRLVEHALVSLSVAVVYCLIRHRRLLRGDLVLIALFAGVFPDVVDKPIWLLGVVPSGRMIAHSLVIGLPIVGVVLTLSYWTGRLLSGGVFAWGYLSHLAGDFYRILSRGLEYKYFPNMLWPIMTPNSNPDRGIVTNAPDVGLIFGLEVLVLVIVLGYAVLDVHYARQEHLSLPR